MVFLVKKSRVLCSYGLLHVGDIDVKVLSVLYRLRQTQLETNTRDYFFFVFDLKVVLILDIFSLT